MTNSHAPGAYHRRSVRLRDYDYGQEGAYFVTLCARDRACLFGDVVDDGVHLTDYGQIANEEWAYTELLRSHVRARSSALPLGAAYGIKISVASAATTRLRVVACAAVARRWPSLKEDNTSKRPLGERGAPLVGDAHTVDTSCRAHDYRACPS